METRFLNYFTAFCIGASLALWFTRSNYRVAQAECAVVLDAVNRALEVAVTNIEEHNDSYLEMLP